MIAARGGDVCCRVDTARECQSDNDGEKECEFRSFGL